MDDQVLFDERGVRVTRTHFSIGEDIRKIGSITAVRVVEHHPSNLGIRGFVVGGAFLAAFMAYSMQEHPIAWGLACIGAIGGALIGGPKVRYQIILGTTGSEIASLHDTDHDFIRRVRDALVMAID